MKDDLLRTPVQFVKGIGPKRAEALRSVGVETLEDLLYYIPRRYLDRSTICTVRNAPPNREVTIVGRIASFARVPSLKGGRNRLEMLLEDQTGTLRCIWFGGIKFVERALEVGKLVMVSGTVEADGFYGRKMIHPDVEEFSEEERQQLHTGRVVPVYPSSGEMKRVRLDSRGLRRVLKPLLDELISRIEDPLPQDILARCGLMPLPEALYSVHFPEDLRQAGKARERLAFDDFFYLELLLARRYRSRRARREGITFLEVGDLIPKLLERLPFQLTEAQRRVMREIWRDMKSPYQMNRLLQGDVGSGKTLVALMTMLIAVANGYQAALMAPTEVLAEQHYLTIHALLEELGVKVGLLIGGMGPAQRRLMLRAMELGEVQIAVGTHTLIQEDIVFKNLGVVVVDEQHRFGVIQRLRLRRKGPCPDVLVMTATPIPRTLGLTLYGDLDVSILDEMPPDRRPVKTVWRSRSRRPQVLAFVREQVRQGRQAYMVYPLVEESEKVDLEAAVQAYEKLQKELPDLRLALLHGRMKGEEKEAVMRAFKEGKIDVLVSTTVIEVGVDIPNATVMVVEHAERFGLAQLHQLRGRVGRGEAQSYCILLTGEKLSDEARERMLTMVRTNDGFEIAEKDLELRGPGEFMGTRQSGMPEFRIAHLIRDS
ncbi:MAG TPA: ATP-dependent DNA helicase RecG, partial [Candidatus Latescibacteria bacterium]|nr:ATP-dependent DNA helicase RecG [Candidatus Latescibacterota bacterium]